MDVKTAKQIFSAGEHLEKQDKISEAIACYQQAVKLCPDDYLYHYKLGNLLRQQQQLAEATQSFLQAIAINSQDSWSYYALGELHAAQQDWDQGIAYYQQAIRLNPDFSWSYFNLGRIYHQQKNLLAAQDCYQRSLALQADFYWGHYFVAEVYRVTDQIEKAIFHYQAAIELNPHCHEAYYQLGRQAQHQEQLTQAVAYYQQATELYQNSFDYYYYWGETLIQLQKFESAISCYERAIALQPNNIQAYFYLATALINLSPAKIGQYQKLSANKSLLFQLNLALGFAQAWQQRGDYLQGIKCCQQAIRLDPTDELPFKLLQYIPVAGEQLAEVIDFYQQIATLKPVSPLLWGNLADLLTQQGKISEAIACYGTSCYENTIIKNPHLVRLNWQQERIADPNFIIVGASKSGTTSLFTYLQQHPQVLAPHKKEIDFFNYNFDLGKAWYLAHFPAICDPEKYCTGEASPAYFYNLEVIAKIKQTCPKIKIIIMLRNPVKRTISEYYHSVNHGIEKRTLTEVIDDEKQRLANLSLQQATKNFGYLLNSIYLEKIVHWLEKFDSKNILIIQSESFFENSAKISRKVTDFLQISANHTDTNIRYNVGAYPPVSGAIKKQLQDFFAPYNQELEIYLGRKFHWE